MITKKFVIPKKGSMIKVWFYMTGTLVEAKVVGSISLNEDGDTEIPVQYGNTEVNVFWNKSEAQWEFEDGFASF